MEEKWKKIRGFERYEISNMGRCRRMKNGSYYFLKNSNHRSGHPMLHLYNEEGHKTLMLSRLVAEAFVPNPNNDWTVKHIDGNTHDNRSCNLYWVKHINRRKL